MSREAARNSAGAPLAVGDGVRACQREVPGASECVLRYLRGGDDAAAFASIPREPGGSPAHSLLRRSSSAS